MGFAHKIPLTWEEIATQHIFDNPNIIDSSTNEPRVKMPSMFHNIKDRRIKYIWQLTDVDHNSYKLNPEVEQVAWLTPTTLKYNMSQRGNAPMQLSHMEWQTLLDSIPSAWRECTQNGNQTHAQGEFFATVMHADGGIGDIIIQIPRRAIGTLRRRTVGHTSVPKTAR